MRNVILMLGLVFSLASVAQVAQADLENLTVSVAYRERIALPPNAQLDVQLLDMTTEDGHARRIASQRFVMTGVPMTVALPYDPDVIDETSVYVVEATIWSGDTQMFRATTRRDTFPSAPSEAINLMLSMIPADDSSTAAPGRIAGIQWAVTEVMGHQWTSDDPATLAIDDEMNISVYGGCNRFAGQATVTDRTISFPHNFAGTLMACPKEIETMERRILDALARVTGYVRYGAGLVLTDATGKAVMHLEERPDL